eukprot:2355916-Rhodomonas_salina.1
MRFSSRVAIINRPRVIESLSTLLLSRILDGRGSSDGSAALSSSRICNTAARDMIEANKTDPESYLLTTSPSNPAK